MVVWLAGTACAPAITTPARIAGGDAATDRPRPVLVQLLAINDFHGYLEPPTGSYATIGAVPAGGVAHLAATIATLRSRNPANTLLVSAGDLIGASPLISGGFHDEPTINAMNRIGLALSAVGNHELDRGQDELVRLQRGGCHPATGCIPGEEFTGARFTLLAANVHTRRGAGPLLFPAYHVHEFDGVPVAFIGITLEGADQIVSPWAITDLAFADEVETINRLVVEIEAQGIEAIVVLLHEGGTTTGAYDSCDGIAGPVVDIARNISSAVDVVISGHTHQAYRCLLDGKLVTSASSFGRMVTRIDLQLDPVSRDVASKDAHNVIVTQDAPDGELDDLVAHYRELTQARGSRVVGSVTATLPRRPGKNGLSALGAVIADAQRLATKADIAITNTGGVRGDLVFAPSGDADPPGRVRYADLFAVQPFGDPLVVVTLTGEQLRAALEQQVRFDENTHEDVVDILQVSAGFSYDIDVAAPRTRRARVSSMALNGRPIDAAARYRVAMSAFLAAGGDGYSGFREGTSAATSLNEMDAVVGYFEAHSPVAPPDLDRIHVR